MIEKIFQLNKIWEHKVIIKEVINHSHQKIVLAQTGEK